ncbi:outer membrane protein assembly factor BamB family protein [Streptomyces lasiicapitis]|uniref:Pyrrolo-quinoline quinone repeat domain-containing protein n=1 Tax=Streptomyces lasiicapitis TaxID=1923961 RepID=A0ABQ2LTE9_9ACTN|nr:PQQ-binding-like beta-propeller repeat protein [Streptomyces lasiicapitis]GGO42872.1 hypothetical protein GCM10012286_25360 [Streptomyces lasiicapitis]
MVSHESRPEPQQPPQQPVHTPLPGNPYAQPEPPAPTGSTSRTRALAIGAGVLALAVVGAGVFFVTRGDGDGGDGGSREPAAAASKGSQEERDSADAGRKSPEADGEGKDDDGGVVDVNAGRKPGEAKAWLAANDVKLPGKGTTVQDLWRWGGIVAQGMYNEVTAWKSADGTKAWAVRLPGELCDTPVNPSSDGKVVVAYTVSKSQSSKKCNQLQMIDLKTGKKGWHKQLVEHDLSDGTTMTHVSISGSTVVVDQDSTAHAYRVRDGKRLFTTKQNPDGGCLLTGVAGGSKLLQTQICAPATSDQSGRLRKVDPRTGKVEWTYKTKKKWSIDKVYSVDPIVLALRSRGGVDDWAVVAIDERGRQRSWFEPRDGKTEFGMCNESGDSGEGTQNCPGGIADSDGDTFYLASRPKDILGPNKITAFDLRNGKVKWTASYPGRQLLPVSVSGDDRPGVVVYAKPKGETGNGRTLRFGPRGGKPDVLLRHTSAARKIETYMFAGHTLYADGRFYVAHSRMDGNAVGTSRDAQKGRMLSYGR